MSETPEKEGQALLDEIFDSAARKTEGGPPPSPGEEPPKAETPGPDRPGSPAKRQTPVFVYLAVLFAAAFAMLLLAYFVQQRNNETAVAGLRDSVDRFQSIDDLLEENRELRDAVDELERQAAGLEALQTRVDELETQNEELARQYEEELDGLRAESQNALRAWTVFWDLEQHYQDREYPYCAGLLVVQTASGQLSGPPEQAAARQQEIVDDLIRRRVLDKDWTSHLEDYQEYVEVYGYVNTEE